MKIVLFGEHSRVGAWDGDRVLDIAAAGGNDPAFASLLALIESGRRGTDAVAELLERHRGSDDAAIWQPFDQVELKAPFPGRQLLLAGSNNADHLSEAYSHLEGPVTVEEAHKRGRALPPSVFWGQARPVMGPNDEIHIPKRANGYFDFEGEAGIVLGKAAKDMKADDILDHIWGVTLVADWSIRVPEWPPKPNPPFFPIKNFDNSKSIGPCIVVGEIDPLNFPIETIVNGKVRQAFNSSDMIYSFGEILEFWSRDFTFHPGDVISGGTGAGTGIDQVIPNADGSWPQNLFLKPGDIVEMRSPAIGSLISHIV